jgi:hypothetical protein
VRSRRRSRELETHLCFSSDFRGRDGALMAAALSVARKTQAIENAPFMVAAVFVPTQSLRKAPTPRISGGSQPPVGN